MSFWLRIVSFCFQLNETRSRDWNILLRTLVGLTFIFQLNETRSRDWNPSRQSFSPVPMGLSTKWNPFAGLKRYCFPRLCFESPIFQLNETRSRDWNFGCADLKELMAQEKLSTKWNPFAGLKPVFPGRRGQRQFFFQLNETRSRDWNDDEDNDVGIHVLLSTKWNPFAGLKRSGRSCSCPYTADYFQLNETRSRDWNPEGHLHGILKAQLSTKWNPFAGLKQTSQSQRW